MLYYTGIGSRETPPHVQKLMTGIAVDFNNLGYCLRSGGAEGADKAFEAGAGTLKEIYLPWKGFNNNDSPLYKHNSNALQIAEQFHPKWSACSQGAKKMHTRNVHQVLGVDLETPSTLLICWTKDGKASGGTGQAIRIAQHYKIPVEFLS